MKLTKMLFLISLMFSLVGCSQKQNEKENQDSGNIPDIADDYFYVIAENTYYTYDQETENDQLYLPFISAIPLTLENTEINFDSDISFDYSIDTNTEADIMPFTVFCSYNGLDWKEYSELDTSDVKEDKEKAEEIYDDLNEMYESYSEPELSKLYTGTISINFNSTKDLVNLATNKMEVTVNGNTKVYTLDKLFYDNQEMANDPWILVPHSLGISGLNLGVIEDGRFSTYCHFNYDASETLEINRIYMYNDSASTIESVNVVLTEDENSTEYEWDGQTSFTLSKGNNVDFTLNVADQDLKGKQLANKLYVVAVDYTVNDENYSIYCSMQAYTYFNAYEYYAILNSTNYYDYFRYYYNYGADWEG